MSENNNVTLTCGGGFLSLLTVALVVLKILGFISWSWWLVLSPMIFGVALVILLFVVIIIIASHS